ncbi:hypothetical protein A2U01_0037501, partial [Trifolium medium]|nr:hypothetical protein [Trifolium medium]
HYVLLEEKKNRKLEVKGLRSATDSRGVTRWTGGGGVTAVMLNVVLPRQHFMEGLALCGQERLRESFTAALATNGD